MQSKNRDREKSEQNLKRCREETGKGYVESNQKELKCWKMQITELQKTGKSAR